MKLYRTKAGAVVENNQRFVALTDDWDALVNHDDLHEYLSRTVASGRATNTLEASILAPIGQQEVWPGDCGVARRASRNPTQQAEAAFTIEYTTHPAPSSFSKLLRGAFADRAMKYECGEMPDGACRSRRSLSASMRAAISLATRSATT
jgi:hypothetical protein